MANIKPTIDQLQAVSEGGVIAKLGDIKAVYRQQTHGNLTEQGFYNCYGITQKSDMRAVYHQEVPGFSILLKATSNSVSCWKFWSETN